MVIHIKPYFKWKFVCLRNISSIIATKFMRFKLTKINTYGFMLIGSSFNVGCEYVNIIGHEYKLN